MAGGGLHATSFWFPQVVDGAGNRSRILLLNHGSQAQRVEVRFFTPSGEPWQVSMSGVANSRWEAEVPARGAHRLESDGFGTLQSGSAEVTTLGPGNVSAVLAFEILGGLVSVSPSLPAASLRQYVTVTDDENTGFALANPNSGQVGVRARLLDRMGLLVSERELPALAPAGRQSCFVTEPCLFGGYFDANTADFEGVIEFQAESGGPVAATGLIQRRDGMLMTLPPVQGFFRAEGPDFFSPADTPTLLRGLNLGGWLVPEGYILHVPGYGSPSSLDAQFRVLAGDAATDEFWERYRDAYVREEDVEGIAVLGFNSIRVPFHFRDVYDPVSGVFDEAGFLRLHRLVDWCRRHGLAVILDLHCAPGGQNPNNISDSDGVARLWLDPAHQELTVRVWKEVARRFAADAAIAGFDLLNEPVLPQGVSGSVLGTLYRRIVTAIREVDEVHAVFLEGNWYGTDFSGLTPPFDENLVYSFHKYWDAPTRASLNRFLELRRQTGRPLWVGEFGENSNPWASEVIDHLEAEGIGWAWWTHKKLETISSPWSAEIPPEYRRLVDYWNGNAPLPSPEAAKQGLLALADAFQLHRCRRHRDVDQALLDLFRGRVPTPYRSLVIPGNWPAVDYDLGGNGYAYFDRRSMRDTYDDNRPWNWGWSYRNDGVDIEASSDPEGSGWNVGWIEDGEWLQYSVEVAREGVFDLEIRVATPQSGGRIRLRWDGADLLPGSVVVPRTGGWQTWTWMRVQGLALPAGNGRLTVEFPVGGFNLGHFRFTPSG